jgi:hypothetical protein
MRGFGVAIWKRKLLLQYTVCVTEWDRTVHTFCYIAVYIAQNASQFVLPGISAVTKMKKCTSCKAQYCHMWRWLSVCSWLDSHFTGRWIGRGINNRMANWVPGWLHVIWFCGFGPQETSAYWNETSWLTEMAELRQFCHNSSWWLTKNCGDFLSGCCNVCKMLGPVWSLALNCSLWDL